MTGFLPVLEFNITALIFILFCVMALTQVTFSILIFSRLSFHKAKTKDDELDGVSILITARNESENIFKNLPFILNQDYPNYEVIVINHQSSDDSKYILDVYTRDYKNLKVISIERNQHLKYGKKLPLTIGIKGAKYNALLFTDIDCKPQGNQWLKSMASHFSDKHQIVLGHAPYSKTKGLLNKVIRFDTTWIAMNYLSMAKAKVPYMGTGRNMAYTRHVFEKVSGFKSHYSLSPGEDNLFIQEAAKKKNYTINIAPESFCYSKACSTWDQWMKQKSRHYTSSDRYKVIKKLLLGIYPSSLLIMLVSFVTLLSDSSFIWISLAIFTLVTFVKWIIIGKSFKKLNASKFIVLLPLLDIAYAILTPIMYYAIDKTNNKKW
ncbi:MAG: glycosyltransferase family 2 protein [Crocinitomicaceae bacterium]|nr:glycosyltransferase family 2 protein [Crocinitomicaceae bacterium]